MGERKEERKEGRMERRMYFKMNDCLWLSWSDLGPSPSSNLFSQICNLEQCHFTSQVLCKMREFKHQPTFL